MAQDNIQGLLMLESELEIKQTLNAVNIRKLASVIDRVNVIKALTYLTTRLANSFNVGKNLSLEQSTIIAIDLFEIFAYESLEDVLLMYKMVRQGKIGDGKDFKLDSQNIFHKWVPAYLELKAEAREAEVLRQKKEFNRINEVISLEDVRKTYEKLSRPQRIKDYIDDATQGFDRQMLEDLILSWSYMPEMKELLPELKKKRLTIKQKP